MWAWCGGQPSKIYFQMSREGQKQYPHSPRPVLLAMMEQKIQQERGRRAGLQQDSLQNCTREKGEEKSQGRNRTLSSETSHLPGGGWSGRCGRKTQRHPTASDRLALPRRASTRNPSDHWPHPITLFYIVAPSMRKWSVIFKTHLQFL